METKKHKHGTGASRLRQAEVRERKLQRIQEQIRDGSLTVRKMTPEERVRFESKRTVVTDPKELKKIEAARKRRARKSSFSS